MAMPTAPPKPICRHGYNDMPGLDLEPGKFCFCGNKGPFAAIANKTLDYCDFSVLPNKTIEITTHTTSSINSHCRVTS